VLPDPEAGALVAQQPAERVRDGDLATVLHPDRARSGPGNDGVPVRPMGAREVRRQQVGLEDQRRV
jgi:hypothetical protein